MTDVQSPAEPEGTIDAAGDIDLFELAATGMLIVDRTGVFRRVNPAFAALVGRAPEELIGHGFPTLTSRDDIGRSEAILERLVAGEIDTARFEKRYVRPDGTIVWADMSIRSITDADKRVVGFVTQAVDITARKAAEQELARQAQLFAATSEGVFVADADGNLIDCNPAAERLSGCSRAELTSAAGGPGREEWTARLRDVIASGGWKGDLIFSCGGLRRVTEAEGFTVPGPDGATAGAFVVCRDVTEARSSAEAQMALRSYFERTDVGVVWARPEDGVIVETTPGFPAMLGYTHDDILGKAIIDLWDPLERERYLRSRSDGTLFDAGYRAERWLRHHDGTLRCARVTAGVLPTTAAGPGLLVGLVEDITHERQLEVELRQAQRLESVGRLAAGIAHEINTPIQFIGDNLNFLSEAFARVVALVETYQGVLSSDSGQMPWEERKATAARAVTEADVEFLNSEVPVAITESLDGVNRVATIVRAMNAFGHPDGGEQTYVDLNDALVNTLTVARNEIKYVADVTTHLGEIASVLCFAGDLNQVFLNLMINAAHAVADTGQRGTITVRSWQDGEEVCVDIGDTGTGIPDDVRDRVFEPFFTTKEVGRGTGQGLALARAVMERHHGAIAFETEPGTGTTFHLRLPISGTPGCQPDDVAA